MKSDLSRFVARHAPMLSLAPALATALALAACTNGQGQADVTLENSLSFAGLPTTVDGVAIPASALSALAGTEVTTDGSVTVDAKDELDSMGKLGTLTATVSKNALSGASLSLFEHVKATIATEDGKMPVQVLTDVDVPPNATEIDLPLQMSDSEVLSYLDEGKVSMHFYVTGKLTSMPVALTYTLVAHVDVAVQGSVLKQ